MGDLGVKCQTEVMYFGRMVIIPAAELRDLENLSRGVKISGSTPDKDT